MTAPRTMRQFMDMTKGRALQIRGRITGRRRTEVRGELKQARAESRASAHRLARRLRHVAHW
ncbi:hypothetical protein KDK95_09780 [Actinospica sp. MGRD01-02]|uniref:CsbD family protein n=1 Tax=Actinospica acidithermotolerans TaxID=2828514 RepID=A0A941E9W2_9ACTN|nr:hypothetical protein [Actinospica acidithermotolerans]MBR7826593.1 hypothetical protein [Actinospica acidithermotolerans]